MFYSRSAAASPEDRARDVAVIVSQAERSNAAAGVNAVLATHGDRYAQVMEGPEAALTAIFDRIQADGRHADVRLLGCVPASGMLLPDQRMTLVECDGTAESRVAALFQAAAQPEVDLEEFGRRMHGVLVARASRIPPELEAVDALFATAVIAADGRLVRGNDNYAALFGVCRTALADRRWRDGMAAGERIGHEALWAALRRGESQRLDYQVRREDGRELWVRGRLQPRLDEAGVLRSVAEIATDITSELSRGMEHRGMVAAMGLTRSVLYLTPDGIVLGANPRLLANMGYTLDEIVGRHHSIFVGAEEAASPAYAALWAGLAAGQAQQEDGKRFGKHGKGVWVRTDFHPLLAPDGAVFKIAAYSIDITAELAHRADQHGQLAAIDKSHCVITFSLDGLILSANRAFLDALGYRAEQVIGRHHRMFVDPALAHGADYAAFWRSLRAGQHQSGTFSRLDAAGREVWLQASYNPVFDLDGRPAKIVKYATVVTEDKLLQAEHQGQIAAIHKAQCVVAFDLDGTVLDANDNFLDALGYRLAEVRGQPHRMFVEPEEAASAAYAAFWADLAKGIHKTAEFKRLGRDGREIWLQASYNPILDLNGRPFRVVKYATDVTAERLRQAELQGQIDAIHKSQGVVSFALDGTILNANDRFLEAFGYTAAEVVGRHHRLLVDPADAASEEYAAFWETLRAGGYMSALYRRVGKNGREVWIQASYNPILDLNGKPFRIVKYATDVTSNVALSEAYEDAKRQAQHDPATSLPNRARLSAFIADAMARPDSHMAVLYLGLDRFKPVNDMFGHQVGDRVLGEVADRLRRALSFEHMVARVGGDEFVVAAPDLAIDEAEALARRLIDVVIEPIRCDAGEIGVGATMGIALAPIDAATPDELLRFADVALHRAKQENRGSYGFFSGALNDQAREYRTLVDDMRRGLEENQFFLEYQPRFDAQARRIRSVEALVRWNHPERGRVSPGEFIPAAERSGLIVALGEWVLRAACRQAADWPSIGVSVNVSPVQFQTADVAALVATVLDSGIIDAHRLELEITEGVLLEDADKARLTLDGLKRLGIRLAIDDFGTGYSSLGSLRSFPFDVIKIDRQFIVDMEARRGGREVVQAILGLGKALGLDVTAEGVETETQLAMLVDDSCLEVQGFLLGRPMSADQIALLLDREATGPAELEPA